MAKLTQAEMFEPAPVEAGLPLWSGKPIEVDAARPTMSGPEVQLRLPDMPQAEVGAIVRDRDRRTRGLVGDRTETARNLTD